MLSEQRSKPKGRTTNGVDRPQRAYRSYDFIISFGEPQLASALISPMKDKMFSVRVYGNRHGGPLSVSFEEVAEQLQAMPQLYFEMDGSFVWVGRDETSPTSSRWQIDGMLYDAFGKIQYVELKGECPVESWKQLQAVFRGRDLSHPSASLWIQFVERDEWMDELGFEQFLSDMTK